MHQINKKFLKKMELFYIFKGVISYLIRDDPQIEGDYTGIKIHI